jgi:hypothetical protein
MTISPSPLRYWAVQNSIFPRIYAFTTFLPSISLGNCTGDDAGMTLVLRGDFPGHRPLWRLCNTVNNLRWTRNAPNSGSG